MAEYCRDDFGLVEPADDDFKMWQGLVGPHYTPSVSEDGTLSWTNDGQLPNPEDVNIKGPPGEGEPGPGVPAGGTTGQILAKASDEDYDGEWIDPPEQPEMDAGHVSYDPTEDYDDGTVGKELGTINSALSSLSAVTEIIDTASGAIASFPDGAGLPMRSLVAEINPVQDLHGQSSPYPAGGGKNKFNENGTYQANTTINNQGQIVSDTTSGLNPKLYDQHIPVTPSTQYTIKGTSTASNFIRVAEYKADGTFIKRDLSGQTTNPTMTFTTDSEASYVLVSPDGAVTNIQLEAGSTASAWSPYSNICPISGHTGLSVEVRGKNLANFVNGKGIATTGAVVDNAKRIATVYPISIVSGKSYVFSFRGDRPVVGAYAVWAGETLIRRVINIASGTVLNTADGDRFYVSVYDAAETSSTVAVTVEEAQGQVEFSSSASAYEPYTSTTTTVSWQDTAGTVYGGTLDVLSGLLTVTDAEIASYNGETLPSTWISDRDVYDAGTTPTIGAQVVYKLATPQTYQLTPQEVDTLLGQNNVWHDANGDTTVTYQASIKGYIDKVLGS